MYSILRILRSQNRKVSLEDTSNQVMTLEDVKIIAGILTLKVISLTITALVITGVINFQRW